MPGSNFSQDHRVEIRFQRFNRGRRRRVACLSSHRCSALRPRRRVRSPVERGRSRACQHGPAYSFAAQEDRFCCSALARDADCSSARIELADVEFQHGNWKVCLAAYDEVLGKPAVARPKPRMVDEPRDPPAAACAMYGRGMTLWHQNRHGESAAQFEELLSLNPRDNQGVRFFIPLLHLLDENTEAAALHFEATRAIIRTICRAVVPFWLGSLSDAPGR